ncbi:vacuolar iron transporter [Xylariales sp. PMI_506]|nr:vacuolar iron transporter [Xylariales sp. PMI_506]
MSLSLLKSNSLPSYSTLEDVEPAIERQSDRPCANGKGGAPKAHVEHHSSHGNVIRDVIIGFADGLTVPFALCAGLSSLGSTRLVVMGGLAELFSGAISMGLGAYLAASTEREHYLSEEARERDEVANRPDEEREEIYEIMESYDVSRAAITPLVDELCRSPDQFVRFMMDFELRLEAPDVSRAWFSALTMGLSYFVGGLIPMLPYFFVSEARHALFASIGITVVILLVFGYVKTWVTIRNKRAGFWGALQTLVVGAMAAGSSYAIVRALDSKST